MSQEKPFFLSQNTGFLKADASVDYLHTDATMAVPSDSATETQYFGFSVPEERIHGLAYMWHHPRLKIVTGGILAWQGIKPAAQFSELFDWRNFMSDEVLDNDLHAFRLENGYGVEVVEPLKRMHLTYEDAGRENKVDLVYDAVQPVVLFGDGRHLEQAMRVRGDLVLRGRHFKVDCFNVRDRSWGKPRIESNMSIPPMSWMTGVFNEDFAFNCCVMDQAGGNPEVAPFGLPDDRTLNGGWLYRDGRLGQIVRVKKRVRRAKVTHLPMEVELVAVDEHDRVLNLTGHLVAANGGFPTWPNCYQHHPLMRWESDGLTTHGDCQEGFWNDYLHRSI